MKLFSFWISPPAIPICVVSSLGRCGFFMGPIPFHCSFPCFFPPRRLRNLTVGPSAPGSSPHLRSGGPSSPCKTVSSVFAPRGSNAKALFGIFFQRVIPDRIPPLLFFRSPPLLNPHTTLSLLGVFFGFPLFFHPQCLYYNSISTSFLLSDLFPLPESHFTQVPPPRL